MRGILIILLLIVGGCSFHREIVNERFRTLDTAWIEPGKTTRAEVVERLGFPPSTREAGGVSQDAFRWIVGDTFTTRFEAGYIVTPTFQRGHHHAAEDILIKFDEQGIVTLLSRTQSDGETIKVIQWKEKQ